MYTAKYNIKDTEWHQTIFKIDGLMYSDKQLNFLYSLVDYISNNLDIYGSIRINIYNKKVARFFIFQSRTESHSENLKYFLNRAIKDFNCGNKLIVPLDYEEHNQLIEDFPSFTSWLRPKKYRFGDFEIYDNCIIINDILDIISSINKETRLGYQVNFKSLKFNLDELKYIKKLIARLQYQSDIPQKFREFYISRLASAIESNLMIDEFIGVNSPEVASTVSTIIVRLSKNWGLPYESEPQYLLFEDTESYEELLYTAIHSDFALNFDVIDKASAAATINSINKLIFLEKNNNFISLFGEYNVPQKKKILFLTAAPDNLSRLRIDKEIKKIDNGLQASKFRDGFELFSKWAITIESLTKALLDEEPQIVHFSTHGETEGLIIEDDVGNEHLIPKDALNSMFSLFTGKVECVVLNACYSEEQASLISKNGIYVIGMKDAVSDDAAIAFSIGFYQSLGAGKDYLFSYKIGLTHIMSKDISQSDIPVLWLNGEKLT